RGRGLRPEHSYQHFDEKSRNRGHHHSRCRAGPRPRRRALHDLPDLARPGLLSEWSQDTTRVSRRKTMSFNLRNRSLLTVQDYTSREFKYLLQLARDLKRAKYAKTEQKSLEGKE